MFRSLVLFPTLDWLRFFLFGEIRSVEHWKSIFFLFTRKEKEQEINSKTNTS